MNENAKKWVDALRSGEYKQAKGQLKDIRNDPRFCCLGVACDLYAKSKRLKWHGPTFLGHYGDLPLDVQGWLGIPSYDGDYKARNGRKSSLTQRNDDGATFNRIADIIASEPEGLFR